MTPAEMAAIHAACFTTPRPWTENEFREVLAAAGSFGAVRPGGFLIGRAIAGEAELLTLAVAPPFRRRGTAQALLSDFDVEAGRRGAARAFLEVASDNLPAITLYTGRGWVPCGRRRGYYRGRGGGSADALVLARPLPPAPPHGT